MGRILIVDDDLVVGQTFARILAVPGFAVTVVRSAAEGLDHARRKLPDAVILDFRMPVASGLSFLSTVRRDPALRELPVAIVTGDHFMDEHVLAELRALGATVRFKPLYMQELIALATSLVARNLPVS